MLLVFCSWSGLSVYLGFSSWSLEWGYSHP